MSRSVWSQYKSKEFVLNFISKQKPTKHCVKLMVMMPRVKQQSKVLKMEKLQWMMMSGLADLQTQDPNL